MLPGGGYKHIIRGGSYVEEESLQFAARFDGGNDCNPVLGCACVFTGSGDNSGCL